MPMLFCVSCQCYYDDTKKFFLSLKQFNLLWLLLLLLLSHQCISIAAAAAVVGAVSSANAKKTAICFLCERTRTHDQSEMTVFVSSGNCFEKVMLLHVQLKCTRVHYQIFSGGQISWTCTRVHSEKLLAVQKAYQGVST